MRPLVPRQLPELRDLPHPIPYQGSKRSLAHAIVSLLPGDTTELIEPFAGSAAVAIAARHSGKADSAVIGDINAPLMALWDRILSDADGLADDYERLWIEQLADRRAYYVEVRAKFNATGEPHYLLYLLARCVKAAVRYNRDGQFNQSPDNRRLGAKPATMRRRLCGASRTLDASRTVIGDYAPLLVDAAPRSVVYMDPPYQGVSNTRDHRYVRGLGRAEFEARLRDAVSRDVSFLLSYDRVLESRQYGDPLPAELGLLHLHLLAGRSSQSTLNGGDGVTIESLYVSPALVRRLGGADAVMARLTGS